MYQYYKGLIIREGADGLKGDIIKKMYNEVGWVSASQPLWLDEKYEICFKNSSMIYMGYIKAKLEGHRWGCGR